MMGTGVAADRYRTRTSSCRRSSSKGSHRRSPRGPAPVSEERVIPLLSPSLLRSADGRGTVTQSVPGTGPGPVRAEVARTTGSLYRPSGERMRLGSRVKAKILPRRGFVGTPDAGVGVLDKRPDLLDAFSYRTYVAGQIAEDDEFVGDDAARSITAS